MSRQQVTNRRVWSAAAEVYRTLLRSADRLITDSRDPAELLALQTIREELRQAHRYASRRSHAAEVSA